MHGKNVFRLGLAIQVFVILVLLLGLLQPSTVHSQSSPVRVSITNLDYSKFPTIEVHAQVLDYADVTVNSLNPSDILLLEDNIPQSFDTRTEGAGTQVAFALDMGKGLLSAGATGNSRIGEMKNILTDYVNQMEEGDQISIFFVAGDRTATILNLESNAEVIRAAIDRINPPATSPEALEKSFGLNAVYSALEDLGRAKNFKTQAVIFLSGGIQQDSENLDKLEKVANNQGIPIHTVLVRPSETGSTAPPMRDLAYFTKGVYVHYLTPTDINSVFKALTNKGMQYVFSYRSTSKTTAERLIEVKLSSGGAASGDSAKYAVNLVPAEVTITQPSSGTRFLRKSEDAEMSMDAVEPTTAIVSGYAVFSDNHPRNIKTAELIIDGKSLSILTDPGTEWDFSWDLRPYSSPGEHSPQLIIKVVDELGMESTSNPVVASVAVEVPLLPEAPVDECANLSGIEAIACKYNKVAGVAAFAVAFATLVLVLIGGALLYRNREKLLEVGGQIGEAAAGAWERMTGGAREKPSAHLTVLTDMYRQTLGDKVEIYRKTETHYS